MVSRRMIEWNKREGIITRGEQKIRRERWKGLKELHRKWIDLDFSSIKDKGENGDDCRNTPRATG